MATTRQSHIKGKRILAVDDEPDILETIQEILEQAQVDMARTYAEAVLKLKQNTYDLAVLDIMGVNGLSLLELAVQRGIPTVMLTAHAINPDTLMASIRKGAIAYLPKETLVELDDLLDALLEVHESGDPPWKLLFQRLGDYFDERFGPGWKDRDRAFWSEFSRSYQVGRGIQERLKHDPRLLDKGV
jgi:CheY-like chemotaxis protein